MKPLSIDEILKQHIDSYFNTNLATEGTLITNLNQALQDYVNSIIGEDDEVTLDEDEREIVWCTTCNQILNADGDCWCKPKNDLRAEQRARLKEKL